MALAAHSAQDIIARPHIWITAGGDGDTAPPAPPACAGEFHALVECVGGWEGDCVACVGGAFEGMDKATTCEDLAAGSFCAEMGKCLAGPCAVEGCDDEAEAFGKCDEENETAMDICPNLCKESPGLRGGAAALEKALA